MLTKDQDKRLKIYRKSIKLNFGWLNFTPKSRLANHPTRNHRILYAIVLAVEIAVLPTALLVALVFGWKHFNPDFEFKLSFDKICTICLALLTVITGTYWGLDAVFGRQWSYCSQALNKSFEENDASKRDLLEAGLACDIHDMRLWGHPTFKGIFGEILKIAILEGQKTYGAYYRAKLKEGKLSYDAAELILSDYFAKCYGTVHKSVASAKKENPEV